MAPLEQGAARYLHPNPHFTSNNVAVLQTLPETLLSSSETLGCCSASDSRVA
jgi:hypothetical protein